MDMKIRNRLVSWLLCLVSTQVLADGVVVIGNAQLPKMDAVVIKKIFTGRVVEVNGVPVSAVNAAPGSPVRQRFLASYLQQDDDKYIAYWTVRQFVGLGRPPRDVDSSAAMIDFVQRHPGAVGYIDAVDLRPGVNVISRQ